jgi:predicted nucleic acid-binding protein
MKKLKIYLDTSVVSHLDAPDAPDKMADTKLVWNDFCAGLYDVVLSQTVLDEIYDCEEPKLTSLITELAKIPYERVLNSGEAGRLRDLYLEYGGLPPKSKLDALHLALASVNGCDVVLSWNFKHIVNLRAMTAVDAVNTLQGYKQVRLLSPTMLLKEE